LSLLLNKIVNKRVSLSSIFLQCFIMQHWEMLAVVLEFWWDRQVTDPEDVLTFRKWRDMDGGLQDPVSDGEDSVAGMISGEQPPLEG